MTPTNSDQSAPQDPLDPWILDLGLDPGGGFLDPGGSFPGSRAGPLDLGSWPRSRGEILLDPGVDPWILDLGLDPGGKEGQTFLDPGAGPLDLGSWILA